MKKHLLMAVLTGAAIFNPAPLHAQTNAAAPAADAASREQSAINKHVTPILDALRLDDAAKAAKVRDLLAAQLAAVHAWHAANDAEIKPLWNEFNRARSAKSATNAAIALGKIDAAYAGFKPQHDRFLSDLAALLSPGQIETVKDVLTVNKVAVTYNVYLQIFPKLTEAEKAVVLQDLKAAREQAIDCDAMTEKSAFFKKYKIMIEDDYLTAQGYNPAQARKDFAARQKTDPAAKKESDQ